MNEGYKSYKQLKSYNFIRQLDPKSVYYRIYLECFSKLPVFNSLSSLRSFNSSKLLLDPFCQHKVHEK